MRKVSAVFLSAIMAVSLAGCGTGENTASVGGTSSGSAVAEAVSGVSVVSGDALDPESEEDTGKGSENETDSEKKTKMVHKKVKYKKDEAGVKMTASGKRVSEYYDGVIIEDGNNFQKNTDGFLGTTSLSANALENSTNLYADMYDSDDDPRGFYQKTLDGKVCGNVEFPQDGVHYRTYEFLYADDNALVYYDRYYDREHKKDQYDFYEIPLEKVKNGNDIIKKEKKKLLFSVKLSGKLDEYFDVYVDSDYVIGVSSKGTVYYRYERENGNLFKQKFFGKTIDSSEEDFCCYIVSESIDGDEIFVSVFDKNDEQRSLWSQNLNTMKWEKLWKEESAVDIAGELDEDEDIEDISLNSDFHIVGKGERKILFSVSAGETEEFYLRDYDSSAFSCIVSDERMRQLLIDEKVADETTLKYCRSTKFRGSSGGRLYFDMEIEVHKGEVCEISCVLFSADVSGKELRYERELTEKMWENSSYEDRDFQSFLKDMEKDEIYFTREEIGKLKVVRSNYSQFEEVQEGKALFYLEKEKEESTNSWVFDFADEKFRKIAKKDGYWWERLVQ